MREDLEISRVILSCLFFGIVVGFIGAVPILWIPNICCLWVLAGGFATTFAVGYGKSRMEVADGAIIGTLFGVSHIVFGEIAYYLVSGLVGALGMGVDPGPAAEGELISGLIVAVLYLGLDAARSIVFGAAGGVLYVTLKKTVKEPQKQELPAKRPGRLGK